MPNLEELENILGYQFHNKALLSEALTHPSIHHSHSHSHIKDYERLEFLGDAVLNLIISEILFETFQDKEGLLAKKRAALVCKELLALIAKNITLGKFITLSKGEEDSGGRCNQTNLENTLEAVIAAIYLDGDLHFAKIFIEKHWCNHLSTALIFDNDPKSSVQGWSQRMGKSIPKYVTICTKGPAHAPIFEIELRITGESPIRATGKSKKIAEKEAARLFLHKYQLHDKTLK